MHHKLPDAGRDHLPESSPYAQSNDRLFDFPHQACSTPRLLNFHLIDLEFFEVGQIPFQIFHSLLKQRLYIPYIRQYPPFCSHLLRPVPLEILRSIHSRCSLVLPWSHTNWKKTLIDIEFVPVQRGNDSSGAKS